MNIRKAETRDIPRLGDLLLQVCRVHHRAVRTSSGRVDGNIRTRSWPPF